MGCLGGYAYPIPGIYPESVLGQKHRNLGKYPRFGMFPSKTNRIQSIYLCFGQAVWRSYNPMNSAMHHEWKWNKNMKIDTWKAVRITLVKHMERCLVRWSIDIEVLSKSFTDLIMTQMTFVLSIWWLYSYQAYSGPGFELNKSEFVSSFHDQTKFHFTSDAHIVDVAILISYRFSVESMMFITFNEYNYT